jgi:DNA-directed RNA polymerase specialized sigma24 family protein
MPQAMHPAVALLVDAVRTRLQAPRLPPSAVRGALHAALDASPSPEGRLTPWISDLTYDTSQELCRRLGVPQPDLPSITGGEAPPRDLAGETVEALLDELDPQVAGVLRQLEVRDVRPAQVAVRLGLPPKRIGVLARQGRAQLHARLIELCQHSLPESP